MEVVTIGTPQLGDRSYLVHDGAVALVVDPQRDIDRVHAAARQAGVRITHIVETHVHNDYVTGGVQLARESGASYLVNGADDVAFDREPVADGDEIDVGSLRVRVVATPGHTHNHVSYLVSSGDEQAVFSGGSLLYGSVGRTDLVDPGDTDELTRAQYSSVRRLATAASDRAVLYPTHGFGSFCSSGPATVVDSATIGDQRRDNHALTDDEDHFVDTLMAGLSAYPGYYAHMGELNRKGAHAVGLSPPEPLDTGELRSRLRDGQWVVDLRNRVVFADDHLKGAVSFEYGDGTSFTTFLGWILPWGTPSRWWAAATRSKRRCATWSASASTSRASRSGTDRSSSSKATPRSPTHVPGGRSCSRSSEPIASRWCSTYAATTSTRQPTSTERCTCPCTACSSG